jgi:hypothetical protein
VVVGENDCGTNENAGLKPSGFVNERVVLDLDVVADLNPGAHIGAATDDAIAPEHGLFSDLGKMPNRRPIADYRAIVDVGARRYPD